MRNEHDSCKIGVLAIKGGYYKIKCLSCGSRFISENQLLKSLNE